MTKISIFTRNCKVIRFSPSDKIFYFVNEPRFCYEGFLIDELLTASPKRYSDQCHDNSLTIFPVDGHS